MPLLHRLLHIFATDGPKAFAGKVYRALRHKLRRDPLPAERPGGAPGFVHPFDRAHGVDTSGFVRGDALTPAPLKPGNPAYYATAYYAIAPSTLKQALQRLPIPSQALRAFTFVDLGCGKGRALLIAAQHGFGSLLGVEISPALYAIARANFAGDARFTLLEQDAATLAYPESPLVIFLFHPFLPPVLRKVLRNLQKHAAAQRRPVFLLYSNPAYPRVMASFPFLERVWDLAFYLSDEDAAADRHGTTRDRFTLYKAH